MIYVLTMEVLLTVMLLRFLYMALKEWHNLILRPLNIWGMIICLSVMIGLALTVI